MRELRGYHREGRVDERNATGMISPIIRRTLWILLSTAIVATLAYIAFTGKFDLLWAAVVDEETHAALFITLFVVLPIIGFPLSVFLLLLGVKFEILNATLLAAGGMAVHIAVIFPVANTILRPMIEGALQRTRYQLPQLPTRGIPWPGIVFMAVPGLSYAMKNYLFSLSGVRFRTYFLIGWIVQTLLGMPIVIAGDVVRRGQLVYTILALALLGVIYLAHRGLRHWARKRR